MTDKERGNAIDWLNDLANTPAEEWQLFYSWSETKENATNALALLKEQKEEYNKLAEWAGGHIVFCKECKYRGKAEKCVLAAISAEKDYPVFMLDNRGEWFCADGVRKDS